MSKINLKEIFDFGSPVFRIRLFMSLVGVVLGAISVAIFKIAALGVDPFQTLVAGIDSNTPIPFGTTYMIINIVLLLFSIIFDRHRIGIATFINLFLLGYITQFTYEFLQTLIPNPNMVVRVICLIVGIVLLCFASAVYFTGDMGVSTYDAVALTITGTWHIGQFKYVRIISDLVCVIAGSGLYLLSGHSLMEVFTIAGVGTIVTAFFMGPLIEVFNEKCARPFLAKAQAKDNE